MAVIVDASIVSGGSATLVDPTNEETFNIVGANGAVEQINPEPAVVFVNPITNERLAFLGGIVVAVDNGSASGTVTATLPSSPTSEANLDLNDQVAFLTYTYQQSDGSQLVVRAAYTAGEGPTFQEILDGNYRFDDLIAETTQLNGSPFTPPVPVEPIVGDGGANNLTGDDADDTIDGGAGEDTIDGGGGADTINGGKNADSIDGGDGDDSINGGNGYDTIEAGDGDDFAKGGARNDYVNGGDGDDTVIGNSGQDTLRGGADDDVVNGGGGDDRMNGDTGNDLLKGGAGEDTFVFDSGAGEDTIQDFDVMDDTIEITTALASGQSAADIAATAQAVTGGTLLDLGDGNTILLRGVTDTTGLEDAIEIAAGMMG